MILDKELKFLFNRYKYVWSIDGKLQRPSEADIKQTVEEAVRLLSFEDSTNSTPQLEVGHIIVQLNRGHYDVYLHIGEVTPTKESK